MKANTVEPSKNSPVVKVKTRKSSKDKKKQLNLTNQWLEENYCVCEGVCIPRCILYSHYLDFCHTNHLTPSCAATFGKIIRQKFPNITTRRLGTRGHSKYHYYGICIRETSQYYHTLYSGGGLTRFSGSKFKSEGGFTRKYSLSSKTGSTIPTFPSSYGLNLPPTINPTRFDTLLVMYHTHCQCILDTIISSRFIEVPTYLMHFWQGIPEHLLCLLDRDVVIDVMAYCDTMLYNSLLDVLIPASMQEVSDQLLVEVENIVRNWEIWLSHCLSALPHRLVQRKISVSQQFIQALKRQAAFIHLAQMVRPVLYDCQMVNQMSADVNSVEITQPAEQPGDTTLEIMESELLCQLKEVLHKQATVEAFTEWLDATLNQRVVKPCGGNNKMFRKKAHSFLLVWSRFGSQLMEVLNEQKASSLTSVNLVRLLLDEYILVAVESQLHEYSTQELMTNIQQYALPSPSTTDGGYCVDAIEMQKAAHAQSFSYPTDHHNYINHPTQFNQPGCGGVSHSSTMVSATHESQSSCRYNTPHTPPQWWIGGQHTFIQPYQSAQTMAYYGGNYTYYNDREASMAHSNAYHPAAMPITAAAGYEMRSIDYSHQAAETNHNLPPIYNMFS